MAAARPFDARLARLSSAELAAFVAALYDARGAAVTREGATVVVDGERIRVASGVVGRLRARFTGFDADAVVAASEARAAALAARVDARPVGPESLWSLARHGLDAGTADAVFEAHLGAPLSAFQAPGHASAPALETGVADAPAAGVTASPAVSAVTLVAALVVALLVAAATPALGPLSVPEPTAAGGPTQSTLAATATPPAGSTPPPVDGSGAVAGGGDDSGARGGTIALTLAPGVAADGITSPVALSEAHAAALGNRSYVWELRYSESVGRNQTARARETVRVETPTRFRSDVTRTGTAVGSSPVAQTSRYATGEVRYRPSADGGFLRQRLPDVGPAGAQGARAGTLVARLLDGDSSTVVRTRFDVSPRQYVLGVRGTDEPGVRDYTATAHVTPSGLVTYLAASYCLVDAGEAADDDANVTTDDDVNATVSAGGGGGGAAVCAEFVFRYRFDDVSVTPPEWYLASDASGARVERVVAPLSTRPTR